MKNNESTANDEINSEDPAVDSPPDSRSEVATILFRVSFAMQESIV